MRGKGNSSCLSQTRHIRRFKRRPICCPSWNFISTLSVVTKKKKFCRASVAVEIGEDTMVLRQRKSFQQNQSSASHFACEGETKAGALLPWHSLLWVKPKPMTNYILGRAFLHFRRYGPDCKLIYNFGPYKIWVHFLSPSSGHNIKMNLDRCARGKWINKKCLFFLKN